MIFDPPEGIQWSDWAAFIRDCSAVMANCSHIAVNRVVIVPPETEPCFMLPFLKRQGDYIIYRPTEDELALYIRCKTDKHHKIPTSLVNNIREAWKDTLAAIKQAEKTHKRGDGDETTDH